MLVLFWGTKRDDSELVIETVCFGLFFFEMIGRFPLIMRKRSPRQSSST